MEPPGGVLLTYLCTDGMVHGLDGFAKHHAAQFLNGKRLVHEPAELAVTADTVALPREDGRAMRNLDDL